MDEFLRPPHNYTGSKHVLMPQLIKLFPPVEDVGVFLDVFAGGLSVSVNTGYGATVANDIIEPLMKCYALMQELGFETFERRLLDFYLWSEDREGFEALRVRYNQTGDPFALFMLCCTCTNNMIRFNQRFEFNQTHGRRTYNDAQRERLKAYAEVLTHKNITFEAGGFFGFVSKHLTKKAFVYLDPPYSSKGAFHIEAGYNAFWSHGDELQLWALLHEIDAAGAKFAVSNISRKNGVENPFSSEFKRWCVHELNKDYNKVSRVGGADITEVLITNY